MIRIVVVVSLLLNALAFSGEALTREKVLAETLKPYDGPSVPGVKNESLNGKVMCGYQGWFNAEGDGAVHRALLDIARDAAERDNSPNVRARAAASLAGAWSERKAA